MQCVTDECRSLLSSMVVSVNSVRGWYAQCALVSGVRGWYMCTGERCMCTCTRAVYVVDIYMCTGERCMCTCTRAVYVVDMHSVHWWAVHAGNRHGFESRRAIAAAHKLLPPALRLLSLSLVYLKTPETNFTLEQKSKKCERKHWEQCQNCRFPLKREQVNRGYKHIFFTNSLNFKACFGGLRLHWNTLKKNIVDKKA